MPLEALVAWQGAAQDDLRARVARRLWFPAHPGACSDSSTLDVLADAGPRRPCGERKSRAVHMLCASDDPDPCRVPATGP
jgi:hypothetical protein